MGPSRQENPLGHLVEDLHPRRAGHRVDRVEDGQLKKTKTRILTMTKTTMTKVAFSVGTQETKRTTTRSHPLGNENLLLPLPGQELRNQGASLLHGNDLGIMRTRRKTMMITRNAVHHLGLAREAAAAAATVVVGLHPGEVHLPEARWCHMADPRDEDQAQPKLLLLRFRKDGQPLLV